MNYEGMEKGKVTVKFDSNRANEANPTSTSKQSHNKKPAAAGFLFDYELILCFLFYIPQKMTWIGSDF